VSSSDQLLDLGHGWRGPGGIVLWALGVARETLRGSHPHQNVTEKHHHYKRWFKNLRSGIQARDADFSNANVAGADFVAAKLQAANFSGVNAANAEFTDADMHDALLVDADVTNATLDQARLQDADLTGVILLDAELVGATLYDVLLNTMIRSGRIDDRCPVQNLDRICTRSVGVDFDVDCT